jgi:hypothetical protein
MRAKYILVAVAVIVIGFVSKQLLLAPKAEADIPPVAGGQIDVLQMHAAHPNLAAQSMHDMTFVFSQEN